MPKNVGLHFFSAMSFIEIINPITLYMVVYLKHKTENSPKILLNIKIQIEFIVLSF